MKSLALITYAILFSIGLFSSCEEEKQNTNVFLEIRTFSVGLQKDFLQFMINPLDIIIRIRTKLFPIFSGIRMVTD
jgi:hypothetical protein